MFGVIIAANGNNLFVNSLIAKSSINLLPLVDTITGSNTIFFMLLLFKNSSITFIFETEESIPILTASTGISSAMQSSCFFKNPLSHVLIPNTPFVFCAVSAVIAVMA